MGNAEDNQVNFKQGRKQGPSHGRKYDSGHIPPRSKSIKGVGRHAGAPHRYCPDCGHSLKSCICADV